MPTHVCRNFNITGPDLYDLFGKYGPIRQIRLGTDTNLKTKGTAYVVFESPDDSAEAMTHLNGFHLMERYIVGMSLVSLSPSFLSVSPLNTSFPEMEQKAARRTQGGSKGGSGQAAKEGREANEDSIIPPPLETTGVRIGESGDTG